MATSLEAAIARTLAGRYPTSTTARIRIVTCQHGCQRPAPPQPRLDFPLAA